MTPLEKHCLNRQYSGTAWAINADGSVSWPGGELPDRAEWYTEANIATFPPPVVRWPTDKFRDRFTAQELVAIKRAGESDDNIALLEIKLFTASEIVSNAASTVGGMALLVQAGILSQERADAILDTTR
jgi:hypothetical protein